MVTVAETARRALRGDLCDLAVAPNTSRNGMRRTGANRDKSEEREREGWCVGQQSNRDACTQRSNRTPRATHPWSLRHKRAHCTHANFGKSYGNICDWGGGEVGGIHGSDIAAGTRFNASWHPSVCSTLLCLRSVSMVKGSKFKEGGRGEAPAFTGGNDNAASAAARNSSYAVLTTPRLPTAPLPPHRMPNNNLTKNNLNNPGGCTTGIFTIQVQSA